MKILVVWDQPLQIELLQVYLGLGDHEVSWADTPEDLLALAEAQPWDIVLLPITLPDVDRGFQTFTQLRSLRPDTHEIQWTSAGHPLPLLQNLDTGEIRPIVDGDPSGLPLAVVPGAEYETVTSLLPPRCRILLYTDGLAEAFPAGDDEGVNQFGEKGIIRVLHETTDLSVNGAMERLFHDSNEFTRGCGRHDDTAVVLVERLKV